MPGRYQFEYNVGNGDIRIYDIFSDGQIQERIAKTNDVAFISTDQAMVNLEIMIKMAEGNKFKYRKTPLYDKISKTKLDILLVIQRFLNENYVSEEEVRLV
jgi:hypothetical protein